MGTSSILWKGNFSSGDVSLCAGQHGPVEVWMVSTPPTIEIINTPDLVGMPFQNKLTEGLALALAALRDHGETAIKPPCDVLYILRGGLNFALHGILWNLQTLQSEVSFVSSQRAADENGVLVITEDSYTKWSLQDRSALVIGDICATGTTMDRAIDAAIAEYARQGIAPHAIIVFTIGTGNLLDVLQRKAESLSKLRGGAVSRIVAVYLEGIFSLYAKHELLVSTHLPATDFFRKDAPLSLELARASLESPVSLFERCAIYDGGSRAFEPNTYLRNLMTYWEKVSLSPDSVTANSFLQVKTGLLTYNKPFDTWLRDVPWWTHHSKSVLNALHSKGQSVLQLFADTKLRNLAERRLTDLRQRSVH